MNIFIRRLSFVSKNICSSCPKNCKLKNNKDSFSYGQFTLENPKAVRVERQQAVKKFYNRGKIKITSSSKKGK